MSVHPDGVHDLPTPQEYAAAYRRLRLFPNLPADVAEGLRTTLVVGGYAVIAEAARLDAVARHRDTAQKQAARFADLAAAVLDKNAARRAVADRTAHHHPTTAPEEAS